MSNLEKLMNLVLHYKDTRRNKIGTDKLIDNFDEFGHIPTQLREILTEKLQKELSIIEEAIWLLDKYRKIGFDEFDDRIMFDIEKFKKEKTNEK